MIEFDVGKNHRVRKVVQELRAFIKKCRVVFIALDNEGTRGSKLKAGGEILRDTANQERWLQLWIFLRRDLVDPRQHAGCGCLSVRAGNYQRLAPSEKLLAQQRGHRSEGNPLIEHALHFRISARKRVADHHKIRRGIEIRFGVRLMNGNAERPEQVAHGRISRAVGAGNAVALQLQEPRQRGHGRAADSAQMNMPREPGHVVPASSIKYGPDL